MQDNLILISIFSAAGFIFLLSKLNLRRVLHHEFLVDTVVTGILIFIGIQSHTGSGAFGGLVAGAAFSVMVYVLKRIMGTERYELRVKKGKVLPKLEGEWVRDPAKWW